MVTCQVKASVIPKFLVIQWQKQKGRDEVTVVINGGGDQSLSMQSTASSLTPRLSRKCKGVLFTAALISAFVRLNPQRQSPSAGCARKFSLSVRCRSPGWVTPPLGREAWPPNRAVGERMGTARACFWSRGSGRIGLPGGYVLTAYQVTSLTDVLFLCL
ncbi:hypothetical protein SKAU_G00074610 [Synaphobranchus kaupii]|uniref:Uncharacterized protein n=1 Tax=Synaphobranchus kaupii TaxID=118154 RepID=A0A9Q1G8D8_SYNKA|nr:hypothetical protein SKAU_G00074610 [Synaphobranchus kaupii]